MADTVERPFDPDDLPIEALQSDDDRAFAASLPARAWAPGGASFDAKDGHGGGADRHSLHGRPLSLRKIAGRLLGSD